MEHVLPAARGLRTLYTLSADRIWFALAVLACLLIAGEIADLVMVDAAPFLDGGITL